MEKEEFESLGFDEAYLEESINEGGERRIQIENEDFEIIKNLLECGGTKAVDAFIDATWNAWYCAQSLIHAVDPLFRMTTYGDKTEEWDRLTDKIFDEVLDSMHLAFINAEVQIVQYDEDPFGRAEGMLDSFGLYCADKLKSIKSECRQSVQTARSKK